MISLSILAAFSLTLAPVCLSVKPRRRVAEEIIPVSVEHSSTTANNETKNGAGRAIDMDLYSASSTSAGSDGASWLKLTLDKVHCVYQVIKYGRSGGEDYKATCDETDCSNCTGPVSRWFTVTVSTEAEVTDLSPVSDCKHGNTVKLNSFGGYQFYLYEIAVVGKPDCKAVDRSLKILVDESQLPFLHGTNVNYTCQTSSILGTAKAVCTNGKVSLYPEHGSACREPSM